MPWYRTGTVAITAGQTTVTGTGTNFSANARVGDAFQGPDGRWYEVTNIASGTVLSILPAYQGATLAAGTYGLAPMQGYVKESADRLRQIVDQWGSTLANLGTVSIENVVPIAKGGTGGTTQAAARAGLGLGTAATATLVGTVTQAGDAVVEYGSNSNGTYCKLAGGLMICQTPGATLLPPAGIGYVGWTFPAQFMGGAPSFVELIAEPGAGSDIRNYACQSQYLGTTKTGTTFLTYMASSVGCKAIAIGRWM